MLDLFTNVRVIATGEKGYVVPSDNDDDDYMMVTVDIDGNKKNFEANELAIENSTTEHISEPIPMARLIKQLQENRKLELIFKRLNPELKVISQEFVGKIKGKLEELLLNRSTKDDVLQRLTENLEKWRVFIDVEVNGAAKDFVDYLNSSFMESYSDFEKNDVNYTFRAELKELVFTYNRKFLLNE